MHVLRDTSGLDTSLRFNRSSNNTAYVINRKVITHHFVYNSNMELLERVPGNLIPRVLSTIADYEVFNDERSDEFASNDYIFAKTDYKRLHKAMYHLLRLCPSICERWTGNVAVEEDESVQSNTASNNKRMRLHIVSRGYQGFQLYWESTPIHSLKLALQLVSKSYVYILLLKSPS